MAKDDCHLVAEWFTSGQPSIDIMGEKKVPHPPTQKPIENIKKYSISL